jgi:hypothetical protein
MLPYINGLIHLVVQHVERWVCTAGLTPLAIAVLVVYIYILWHRHAHA